MYLARLRAVKPKRLSQFRQRPNAQSAEERCKAEARAATIGEEWKWSATGKNARNVDIPNNSWYWLEYQGRKSIVHVVELRAFGNRLCAFLDKPLGGWTPVEELLANKWAGPIKEP